MTSQLDSITEMVNEIREKHPKIALQLLRLFTAKVSLITTVHGLSSDIENNLGKFQDDLEAKRQLLGSIKHSREIAASLHELQPPITDANIRVGGVYKWKSSSERLIFIGCRRWLGNWYQFKKIDDPQLLRCEVREENLRLLEETL